MAAFKLVVFGFLRIGELTMSSNKKTQEKNNNIAKADSQMLPCFRWWLFVNEQAMDQSSQQFNRAMAMN